MIGTESILKSYLNKHVTVLSLDQLYLVNEKSPI